MKKIYLLVLLVTISFNCLASDVFEIEVFLEVKQLPIIGKNANQITDFISIAEKTSDQKLMEMSLNSAANAINIDIQGYEFEITFKAFIEFENKRITRYRFEGIIPVVNLLSESITNSPQILYNRFIKELHNGTDYYLEFVDLDKPEQAQKGVYKNKPLTTNELKGHWSGYINNCLYYEDLLKLVSKNEKALMKENNLLKYKVNDKLSFDRLIDNSAAYLVESNSVEERFIKTAWQDIDKKNIIFAPKISLHTPSNASEFQLIKCEKLDNSSALENIFEIPLDAKEAGFIQSK